MELKTLKALALTSATVIGLATAGPAYAQSVITTSITTSSAITANVINGTTYGTYLIQRVAPDTPVLTMSTDGTNTVTVTGTAGGSQIVFVSGTPDEGAVTVQIPAPAVLQMDYLTASLNNFAAASNMSLTRVDYRTATENGNFLTNADSTEVITVVAGGVPEPIAFGGQITVSDTPADGAYTADVTVDFSY